MSFRLGFFVTIATLATAGTVPDSIEPRCEALMVRGEITPDPEACANFVTNHLANAATGTCRQDIADKITSATTYKDLMRIANDNDCLAFALSTLRTRVAKAATESATCIAATILGMKRDSCKGFYSTLENLKIDETSMRACPVKEKVLAVKTQKDFYAISQNVNRHSASCNDSFLLNAQRKLNTLIDEKKCYSNAFKGIKNPACEPYYTSFLEKRIEPSEFEACPFKEGLFKAKTHEDGEATMGITGLLGIGEVATKACAAAIAFAVQQKIKALNGWKAMDYAKLAVGGLAATAAITAAVRPDLVEKAKRWFRGDQKKIEPEQTSDSEEAAKPAIPAKPAESGMSWPVIAGIIIAVIAVSGLAAFFVLRGRS